MRKLLVAFLLSPLLSGEEVDYPIELTCTGGSAAIIYFYLTKEETGSWFKLIDPYFLPSKKGNELLNNKKISMEKNILELIEVHFWLILKVIL